MMFIALGIAFETNFVFAVSLTIVSIVIANTARTAHRTTEMSTGVHNPHVLETGWSLPEF